jgi:DNA replication and repair protein RecF
MTTSPHAITTLTLENFRNYAALQLAIPAQPVVLTGHNGAGKTNILEAISLLAPGRGMRGGKLREMDRMDGAQERPWVVAATVQTDGRATQIGTGRDAESVAEKRLIRVDGVPVRKQALLAEHACIQWLTPGMDGVFMEGGTARRKLLDRLTYSFSHEHAARVTAYEVSMRERNRLLTDRGRADPYWLSVLEQQMAEHAVAITLARLEAIERISAHLAEKLAGFPRAFIALQGTLEGWLGEGASALDAESKLAERLRELRPIDSAAGRAGEGAHRSHFHVIHREKNMLAERCSTGEQKAVLLSLILAAARARVAWCGVAPILLLDEVVAHLDVDKRRGLFDLIRASAIQAWMTGTDAADFQGIEGFCTHLEIAGGTVRGRVKN